jgi:hypothetical protein
MSSNNDDTKMTYVINTSYTFYPASGFQDLLHCNQNVIILWIGQWLRGALAS